ncbi:hypothetical protein V6N13_033566 [Hibiscus sabdariffa]|uniref:Uncharacterized protein n=1 Tax=Hibiscus sabdariffa TaxID=183260 RepID=A0ABR2FA56_9ROSI
MVVRRGTSDPIVMDWLHTLVLSLTGNAIDAEAKSYGGRKTMQKTRIDSQSIMHALMEDCGLSAMKLERRALTDTARISPGGPDPQHD